MQILKDSAAVSSALSTDAPVCRLCFIASLVIVVGPKSERKSAYFWKI